MNINLFLLANHRAKVTQGTNLRSSNMNYFLSILVTKEPYVRIPLRSEKNGKCILNTAFLHIKSKLFHSSLVFVCGNFQ